MYLDYAERQARKRRTVTMAEWSDKLDAFLKQNEEEILTHSGTVKAEVAKKIAEERYDEFEKKRKIAEAKKADEEDLKELEEMEKRLLNNRDNKGKSWKKETTCARPVLRRWGAGILRNWNPKMARYSL